MDAEEIRPKYWDPIIKSMLRRCRDHDYCHPGYYMITMTSRKIPSLGYLDDLSDTAKIRRTMLGDIAMDEIFEFKRKFPQIAVICFIIMPDHVHLLIHVLRHIDMPMGDFIRQYKLACTSKARSHGLIRESDSFFETGFNDRIMARKGMISTYERYINDNPKRLKAKTDNRDLFRRYNNLVIGTRTYDAFGNIFLLRNPEKMPVRIHRRWSPTELESHMAAWTDCILNGGVLVSPFLHDWERDMRSIAIERGGRLIRIQKEGMPRNFKPTGWEFELCAEGRLLILSPWPDNPTTVNVYRHEALDMNAMSAEIASLDYSTPIRLRRPSLTR